MRRLARAAAGAGLCLLAGCATTAPSGPPRPAAEAEQEEIGRALLPLLPASGLWRGPADGCAVALGIVPTPVINLAVAPHPRCKLALLVTAGALDGLSPGELQAALAHEIGHVELGHFAARKARREAERKTDQGIGSAGAAASATAAAIPGVGAIVALGMITTQVAADLASKSVYRGYDREEEEAADRYAEALLNMVQPGRCRALVQLLRRLEQDRRGAAWAPWLSTHPTPARRREAAAAWCPSP